MSLFKKNHHHYQKTIARTGFFTSLTSYVLFWLFDLLRPGFVSRYFSVHVFLLLAILFGFWWSRIKEKECEKQWVYSLIALLFGFLLAVVTWSLGEGFGAYRILIGLIALITPALFFRLLIQK